MKHILYITSDYPPAIKKAEELCKNSSNMEYTGVTPASNPDFIGYVYGKVVISPALDTDKFGRRDLAKSEVIYEIIIEDDGDTVGLRTIKNYEN